MGELTTGWSCAAGDAGNEKCWRCGITKPGLVKRFLLVYDFLYYSNVCWIYMGAHKMHSQFLSFSTTLKWCGMLILSTWKTSIPWSYMANTLTNDHLTTQEAAGSRAMMEYPALKTRMVIMSQITRFMGPTWGSSWADRTQVGPMLAPWTLLSGVYNEISPQYVNLNLLSDIFRHSTIIANH